MKTQNYIAKKLKGGYIMVRDYNADYCYKSGCDLVVTYKGKNMTIKNVDLKNNALKLDNKTYQSNYQQSKNQKYGVYHYRWIPDGETDNQMSLFESANSK